MVDLTPEQSRDLAERYANLGPRLSVEHRALITEVATTQGYDAAVALLPGDKGDQPRVTIETAAWVLTEVMDGKLSFDAALRTLRDAAREGL